MRAEEATWCYDCFNWPNVASVCSKVAADVGIPGEAAFYYHKDPSAYT